MGKLTDSGPHAVLSMVGSRVSHQRFEHWSLFLVWTMALTRDHLDIMRTWCERR